MDRAYLERDRLRYSKWTGPTWRGTGSGIGGGQGLPREGQAQLKEVDRAYLERDRLRSRR